MGRSSDVEREQLLTRAGVLRFEQKTHTFVEAIHGYEATYDTYTREDAYTFCLIPALAEGLAYGRDRAFFRVAALRLLDVPHELPEPLGRAATPAPLDATRLAVISMLISHKQSLWPDLRNIFHQQRGQIGRTIEALRAWLHLQGVRGGRTDIVICNVLLPFAAAVALLEHDEKLGAHALHCYQTHPGLVSNRVTRQMTRQLALPMEPRNACQQQGLHYIYQQTCREKLCEQCIAGRERL
jgi:hypothetical protein